MAPASEEMFACGIMTVLDNQIIIVGGKGLIGRRQDRNRVSALPCNENPAARPDDA